MLNVVLYQPLIPQNTGTIARLTAATETFLHIIEPTAFEISDKQVKRAGLDYWPWVKLTIHKSWDEFLETEKSERLHFYTKHATTPYWEAKHLRNDYLIFGNEEQGLSPEIHERYKENRFVIPMTNSNVRSINLACSVSTVLYEAIRQITLSD